MNTPSRSHRWQIVTSVAITGVAILVAFSTTRQRKVSAGPPDKPTARADIQYSPEGQLLKPTGYRRWVYVGTPLTPNDMNGGKAAFPEFHSVYMNPEAYEQYSKSGEFADGTVLVKELLSVGSKQASSGKGYFMGDFSGLEVSIKDAVRFKDQPGHWAFFSFGHEYPLKEQSTALPTANCNTCHGGAADDDYVFTQYYPVLRDAKQRATPK